MEDILTQLETRFDSRIVQPDELARDAYNEIKRLRLENLNKLPQLNEAYKRIRSMMGVK